MYFGLGDVIVDIYIWKGIVIDLKVGFDLNVIGWGDCVWCEVCDDVGGGFLFGVVDLLVVFC